MPTQITFSESIEGGELVEIVEASMRELPNFLVYRNESFPLVTLDARVDVNFFDLAGSISFVEMVKAQGELNRLAHQHFIARINAFEEYRELGISVGRLDKTLMTAYDESKVQKENQSLYYLVNGIYRRVNSFCE